MQREPKELPSLASAGCALASVPVELVPLSTAQQPTFAAVAQCSVAPCPCRTERRARTHTHAHTHTHMHTCTYTHTPTHTLTHTHTHTHAHPPTHTQVSQGGMLSLELKLASSLLPLPHPHTATTRMTCVRYLLPSVLPAVAGCASTAQGGCWLARRSNHGARPRGRTRAPPCARLPSWSTSTCRSPMVVSGTT
jgi:hypothetical protein